MKNKFQAMVSGISQNRPQLEDVIIKHNQTK